MKKIIHIQTNQGKNCLMSFVLKQVMKRHQRCQNSFSPQTRACAATVTVEKPTAAFICVSQFD